MQKIAGALLIMFCITMAGCSLFQGGGDDSRKSEDQDGGKIIIRWRNESEHDNYGFNIYRGESKDGPFKKINKEIIPGAGTTSSPKEYVYVDQPLEIGDTYYYYIESISFAGEKERITPPTRVIVKTPISKEVN